MTSSDPLRHPRFTDERPFSIGIEEELFLVDPRDGTQLDAREEVLGAVGEPPRGEVTGEVHACEVELISGVCETPAEAVAELEEMRAMVIATGIGLIGSATHPSAEEGSAGISETERYELVARQLGDAAVSPVAAMHVHVGVPDAETAIRVFNGMRRHLPLLEALAANSPYRHGRDSGFASARELSLRAWPRSGAPRAMDDYADFVDYAERLTRAAGVPDYTFNWWKLRPHPKLGTVEVRALDVQSSPWHAAALAALVQSLARHEATATEAVPSPPPEILEEGSYRAAREGLVAELPDAAGNLSSFDEVLADALRIARPCAEELGCLDELLRIPALVGEGGGAGLQRRDHERGGMPAVLGGLLERTRA
jgi:carboxylate-amine ligase